MEKDILIEVSARHVHLTSEAVSILFGEGAILEPRKNLTQPGLFACKQKVNLVGPKGRIEGVTILAPTRKYVQVEISKTDARKLGLEAPVRMSGDHQGSCGCILEGTHGSVELAQGVIVPRKHIHMNTKDAAPHGIEHGDRIDIQVDEEEGRKIIFQDVIAEVHDMVQTFVHIDTDEGNAAGISKHAYGSIVKVCKKGDVT